MASPDKTPQDFPLGLARAMAKQVDRLAQDRVDRNARIARLLTRVRELTDERDDLREQLYYRDEEIAELKEELGG